MKCASRRRKKKKQWKVLTVATAANGQQVSVSLCVCFGEIIDLPSICQY